MEQQQQQQEFQQQEQQRLEALFTRARQRRLGRALAEERSRMESATSSTTAAPAPAPPATNGDTWSDRDVDLTWQLQYYTPTIPLPHHQQQQQPGHPPAGVEDNGDNEPSPLAGCFDRWAFSPSSTPANTNTEQAPPAPAAARDADNAEAEDEAGKWQRDRLYIGGIARYIADRMEMPNAFFCSVFLLAFIFVETRIAKETQYQTLFIIFSPIALMWSTVYVTLQLLVLLEESSMLKAAKEYFVRFWNPLDLIIVIVLWAKFHDSFSISQAEPDPRGFESITNDNKATEWYFLLSLRAFHLVGLFRTLAAQSERLTQLWLEVSPEWLSTLLVELDRESDDRTRADVEASLPEV